MDITKFKEGDILTVRQVVSHTSGDKVYTKADQGGFCNAIDLQLVLTHTPKMVDIVPGLRYRSGAFIETVIAIHGSTAWVEHTDGSWKFKDLITIDENIRVFGLPK